MKKVIQTIMAVPISDAIGKSFGQNKLLGTGVALVTARFVLRSFAGMVALGVLAGGLNYLRQHKAEEGDAKPDPSPQAAKPAQHAHDDVEPVSA